MTIDPWLAGALGVILLAVAGIAGLSSLETAVLFSRRSRLAGFGPADRVREAEGVLESPDRFQASAHLAKSLLESVVYAAAALVGLDLALVVQHRALPDTLGELLLMCWPGMLIAAAAAYLLVTLLGEAIPKGLAARFPERLLLRMVGLIRGFTIAFTPVLWITSRLGRLLATGAGADLHFAARAAHSEEEIKLLVEGSAEEGVLEEEEKEMIHSIIDFPDTNARQIMVPRIDIASVSVDASLPEVARAVLESGHSRLPVYEGTLDNVVGIVHVKDLIPPLLEGRSDVPLRSLLRKPVFIPESKKLDALLRELKTHKTQLAVVVDEFGGTSGLVTVEDVLEEIVGEIQDEYDVDETVPELEEVGKGEGYLVDARMPVEEVEERLELEIPEGDYDTIGGFVFALLGRPPQTGEWADYGGYRFIVEATDGLRLQKIRIAPVPPGEPDEATEMASTG